LCRAWNLFRAASDHYGESGRMMHIHTAKITLTWNTLFYSPLLYVSREHKGAAATFFLKVMQQQHYVPLKKNIIKQGLRMKNKGP